MSFIIRLAKNLPLDIAKNIEIDGNDNSNDDKTVKKLPLSKKSNVLTGYLTFLYSKKKKDY